MGRKNDPCITICFQLGAPSASELAHVCPQPHQALSRCSGLDTPASTALRALGAEATMPGQKAE